MAGKNFNYFLIDDIPNGRVKCTFANWTGVAYRIPRVDLDKCKDRPDLQQSGVYFLFGTDDNTGENAVYVGQADVRKNGNGLLGRLIEHKSNSEKDYWTEAVVFTTKDKDNWLGATEISWLESYFCNLAKNAKRYAIKNSNEPSPGKPTEEKISDLEEFAKHATVVMGVLNHRVFEPLIQKRTIHEVISEDDSIEFRLEQKMQNSGLTLKASCKRSSEGYIVLKGSMVNPKANDKTCSGVAKRAREQTTIENNILMEDTLFPSPSAAAMFVTGASANGYTVWKTADGKTLKDIESSEASEI